MGAAPLEELARSAGRLPPATKRWLTDCIHRHADEPFALADMTAEGLGDVLAIRDSWKAPGHHYGVDLIQELRTVRGRAHARLAG